jgi:hypothetical protein
MYVAGVLEVSLIEAVPAQIDDPITHDSDRQTTPA